jgi:2-dehydropantoate 2-reductase
MTTERPSVAVIGAGAIGGITAVNMERTGWSPVVVTKHQSTVEKAADPGIHIFGLCDETTVPVRAVARISDLDSPKDIVLLATKANDSPDAAKELLPFLHERSRIVSLQNGICEDSLAEIVGHERLMGCVTGWGATMHGPGELEMTSPGEFVIGRMDGGSDPVLPVVKEMLESTVPTRISQNIRGELYSKLIVNACINSLGAITGLKLGKLLALKKVRRIFLDLMREMMSVADAAGITVEPGGGGKLDYYSFLAEKGPISELKRHVTIRAIGFKYRRIRSSSLQSLERGRKTEIDYLNGYVCRLGNESGVPTPLNRAVVSIVKEIEDGTRRIGPENLNDPAFEKY